MLRSPRNRNLRLARHLQKVPFGLGKGKEDGVHRLENGRGKEQERRDNWRWVAPESKKLTLGVRAVPARLSQPHA